jgi:DNA-binding transcriptional LysR family regulator
MSADLSDDHVRDMDLNLLRVFNALLRYHKVTVAAERLGLTPSAVSQELARLRSTFDDPLFLRTGHGLKPTPRALELEPGVGQVIETVRGLLAGKGGLDRDGEAVLRVGFPDNVSQAFASFVELARRDAPQLRFSARCIWGRKGVEALMEDEIDLALFHIADAPPDIERRVLYLESDAVIARRGHPLAARALDLDGYAAADHVVGPLPATSAGSSISGSRSWGACGVSSRPCRSSAPRCKRSPAPT